MNTSSPFSQHLDTNYIPSHSEVNEIRKIIQSHQSIVNDMEKQMQELQHRRQLHTEVIEQHSALLSPVKRVPTDILSSIFLVCLPPRHPARPHSMSRGHPAITISHVCQQWRRVALESPLLWSAIQVRMPFPPHVHYTMRNRVVVSEAAGELYKAELVEHERRLQVTKDTTLAWLSRSANCPLDITLICEDSVYGRHSLEDRMNNSRFGEIVAPRLPQPTSIDPVIVDLILSASRRWKRVSFDLTIAHSNSPLLRLLETLPAYVPQLEAFQFAINLPEPLLEDIQSLREGIASRVKLFQAPNLRNLVLDSLWVPIDQLQINWAALTELYLGPYLYNPHPRYAKILGASYTLSVLKTCPNLVRCLVTLDMESPYDDPIAGISIDSIPLPLNERVTLPHLTSMSIQGSRPPKGFASSLNLPSLRTLFLACDSGAPEDEENSGFVECVQNFGDALTEITFEHSALTESALLHCLERLPNLVTLRMVDSRAIGGGWGLEREDLLPALITDAILMRLTPTEDGDQCYCPQLQNFSCRMKDVEFTEKGLAAFIAGRRQRHLASRLNRVVVRFNIAQRMDIRKELMGKGVDLEELSLVIKYNETLGMPFRAASDKRLENLLPEDQMVASEYWMLDGAEWWC